MKEIKVFFTNLDGINLKKYFPTRILFDNFNIKPVKHKDEAEVIIGGVIKNKHQDYINPNKKSIILSGENIYFRRNFLSLIESLFGKVGGDKKYKIVDFLDNIIPKFLSDFKLDHVHQGYLNILKKVNRGEIKNVFFVLSNEKESENAISFPFFLQDSYYELKKLSEKRRKGGVLKNLKFCAFLVASNSSRERVHFFRKLSKYKKVDSYGKVMNNMDGQLYNQVWNGNPEINPFNRKRIWRVSRGFLDKGWKSNPQLFKNYRFVICFENSFEKDYVTEKLPNVFVSGAIPIYQGAPNVAQYFNTKSFVNYDNYGSYREMIKKIIELDKNKELYLKMLNESPFPGEKWPKIYDKKTNELIKFYKKILLDTPKERA